MPKISKKKKKKQKKQSAEAPSREVRYDYAGFGVRFAAFFIDCLLYGLVWAFVMKLSGGWDVFMNLAAIDTRGHVRIIEQYEINQAIWLNIILTILFGLYFVFTTASGMRGTLGKVLMGVTIVNHSGGQIGLAKSLIREVAKLLSGAIVMIGFLLALVAPKKRALHDFIAFTLPVKRGSGPASRHSGTPVVWKLLNGLTGLALIALIAMPIYALVTGMTPPKTGDSRVDELVERKRADVNRVALEEEKRSSGVAADTESESEEVAPPTSRYDYSAVTMVLEQVKKSTIAKRQYPSHFSQLGIPIGDLFDRGVQKFDIASSGVLEFQYKPESSVGDAKLIIAPYLDNGNVKWTCRSLEIRDEDLPLECDR